MQRVSVHKDESGLAAITVTLIILGIVTLITVGFATLMRREQRQALDQQLSTQAFYAAESGVNAAREFVETRPANQADPSQDCSNTQSIIGNANLSDNVSVSCVLLDTTPDTLEADVQTEKSWLVKVQTADGSDIEKIEIAWEMAGSDEFAPTNWAQSRLLPPKDQPNGSTKAEWGNITGMLRVMVIPDINNRTQLIDRTFHTFLYPSENNNNFGTVDWRVDAAPSTDDQGRFLFGNCNTNNQPRSCRVLLSMDENNQDAYYVRIRSIYNPSNVSVRVLNNASEAQDLQNGQAKIDATGKAADVVRRIQVNVPLETGFLFPEYALETFSTLCKRFITYPAGSGSPGESISDLNSSTGTTPLNSLSPETIAACEP